MIIVLIGKVGNTTFLLVSGTTYFLRTVIVLAEISCVTSLSLKKLFPPIISVCRVSTTIAEIFRVGLQALNYVNFYG